jgi:hypothetical protein
MSKPESRKPDKEFRIAGIKLAIWQEKVEVDGQTVLRNSIHIQKRFKQKNGEWSDTEYFFPDDLPRLRVLIDRAFEFVSNLKEGCPESAGE